MSETQKSITPQGTPDDVIQKQKSKSKSEWGLVFSKFRRHRLSLVGCIIMLIFILTAILADFIAPYDPNMIDPMAFEQPPSKEHLLGTDSIGRDVLSRIIHASRVSLTVGIAAVILYLGIGIVLGAIAGYFRGIIDTIIMRFADAMISFPVLPLVIVMVAIAGNSIYNIILVIGLVMWPEVARIVRGQILSLREQEFVEAARSIGEKPLSIIFTQLIPNVLAPVIVAGTFGIANAILLEAGLSFLGLGVQPPDASWGNMLMDAQSITVLTNMPWLWVYPSLCIILAVISINFIGDGLRDALDPRQK
ncbi:oligopeptide ABC transporter permease [Ferdinandcohnia sp. SAFN-114]|uniref:oligopeptide ABC transporter permease n=1 Tax=Ferdinandcohnia sp. SAFN-114 TaxID=3387275 RepID=UPI003F7EA696